MGMSILKSALATLLFGLALDAQSPATQAPPQLEQLRVKGRFLEAASGRPFFWLGDTSWALVAKARREDLPRYFGSRVGKGFNVLQTCVTNEPGTANAYGEKAFEEADYSRPREPYWRWVDEVVDAGARHGMYLALLPMWGNSVPNESRVVTEPPVAYRYGHFLGARYRDRKHIIWVLGGDPRPDRDVGNPARMAMTRAMAEGIADGTNGLDQFDGRADYRTTLITYHPRGPNLSSSEYLHSEEWLDFNMIQTTTRFAFTNYEAVAADYGRVPVKPTLDAEVAYEDSLSLSPKETKDRRTGPWEVRKAAWWNVFAGSMGHTFGHRSFIGYIREGETWYHGAHIPWFRSLDSPGALQVALMRRLMESRPFWTGVPDPSIVTDGAGEGMERAVATRGRGYAMVYLPVGRPLTVNMPGKWRVAWFDPRTGRQLKIGTMTGSRHFTPPSVGEGQDWVLLLDQPANRK